MGVMGAMQLIAFEKKRSNEAPFHFYDIFFYHSF